jgi:hypothetical protein
MNGQIDTWLKRFNSWGALLVTVFVLTLFAMGLIFSYWAKVDPSQAFSNLMETIKTLAVLVVGYWVGSSNSSQKKDDTIASNAEALATSTPLLLPPPGTTTTIVTPETSTVKVQPPVTQVESPQP